MNRLKESQAPSVSLRRRFFSVPTLLSFGVVAALIVLLSTSFNLDWDETWDNVRRMNPWLYLLALVFYYLSFAFRGARWRTLARNAGADTSAARLPSAFECSRLILIGWFVNAVSLLRLGDAYRAYAFSRDSKSEFSWSLGTVLAERVLDMATIFAILVVSGIYLATTRDSSLAYVVVAAFAMASVLVAVILLMKRYGTRVARFLPGRMQDAYGRFHQGALGSFRRLPVLIGLGLAGWFLEIARLYFVIEAWDSSQFPASAGRCSWPRRSEHGSHARRAGCGGAGNGRTPAHRSGKERRGLRDRGRPLDHLSQRRGVRGAGLPR